MRKTELDKLLERAVAEALGVKLESPRPARRRPQLILPARIKAERVLEHA